MNELTEPSTENEIYSAPHVEPEGVIDHDVMLEVDAITTSEPEGSSAEEQEPPRRSLALTPRGNYAIGIAVLSLIVRLIPAYFVYGSFDVGGWEYVLRFVTLGQNPYNTGKLNWPPLWLMCLRYADRLTEIYQLPESFAVKIIPCVADSLIAVLLFLWFSRQSQKLGPAFRKSLWYALNPIAIATCALQGQFESLPSVFTLLAVISAARSNSTRYPNSIMVWLGLAGLAKTWPLILTPAFLRDLRSRGQQAAAGLLILAPALLTVSWLYIQDPKAIRDNVINYHGRSGVWGLTALNTWLSAPFDAAWSHTLLWIMYAAILAVYALIWRKGTTGQAACLGVLTFYVFTPGFGPQYTTWILAIALLIDSYRARLYTILAGVTLSILYFFWPYNGEHFDFVRHQHTRLFWATYIGPHALHTGAILFLPLWIYCVWWWSSLLREALRTPLPDNTADAVVSIE